MARAWRGSGIEVLSVPSVGAAVACGGSGASTALLCPQKTVYGANVIVFEGILAFANKELLKVSLPDAAGGPSLRVAWEGARGGVRRVGEHRPGPALSAAGAGRRPGAAQRGVTRCLLAEHLRVGGFRGGALGAIAAGGTVGEGSEAGTMRGAA